MITVILRSEYLRASKDDQLCMWLILRDAAQKARLLRMTVVKAARLI